MKYRKKNKWTEIIEKESFFNEFRFCKNLKNSLRKGFYGMMKKLIILETNYKCLTI